ncbi:MAG: HAD family hydrolase [Pseudomonadota bacterium]
MHSSLVRCDTLLLDMDGTLLDLAYDNYFWQEAVPKAYANTHGLADDVAMHEVAQRIARERGTMNWYDLEFWSDALKIDVLALKHACADRIAYLDGVTTFLQRMRDLHKRLVLVTNSSSALLTLKHARTGVCDFMDAAYSSDQFGIPKEVEAFWPAFAAQEPFDPARTLLLDDSIAVLDAASAYGIRVLGLTRPDSRYPARSWASGHASVSSVIKLLG